MKKFVPLFLLLMLLLLFMGPQYKSEDFYFSVDMPDNWTIDDKDPAQILLKTNEYAGLVMLFTFELNAATSNADLGAQFIKGAGMSGGKFTQITFCKYDALRGLFTFTKKGKKFTSDIVIVSDDYYYYMIVSAVDSSKYESKKDEINKIIMSFKIYYDNDVVYGNDDEGTTPTQTANNSDLTAKTTETQTTQTQTTQTQTGATYQFSVKWNKVTTSTDFFQADLQKSTEEMTKAMNGDWGYYGIDPDSSDAETQYWNKFYQDMFNKNFNRVSSVVDWFTAKSKASGWNAFDLASNMLAYIQNIPYERPQNIITNEKNPINFFDFFTPNQIAYYGKGDCDSKSMFYVILLKKFGFQVVIFHSDEYSHAMAGIKINTKGTYKTYNNDKYYFCETTYPGWKIGELPEDCSDTGKWFIAPLQ